MNKVAVISGGSRGIGYGIAKKLQEKGYTVYIIGVKNRTETELSSQKYSGMNYINLDITDYASVKNNFKRIYEKHARLDVLVNSAGIVDDKKIKFMTVNSWNSVVDANLNGVFWAIKCASNYMINNREGVILNVSSVASKKAVNGQSNYASSKAGVEALTRVAALELAQYNIRVNSISPGYIDTDMLSNVIGIKEIVDTIPLNRLGRVEDIAELAAFLISEKAGYITGQNFIIDGGVTL